MSLRKNRIACQGVNNLSQTDLITNRTLPFMKLTNKTTIMSSAISKTSKNKIPSHNISKYDAQNLTKTVQHLFVADKGTRTDQNWHVQPIDHTIQNYQLQHSHTLLNSKLYNSCKKSLDKQPPKPPQKLLSAIEQIRSLYKYNANVRKIIKAWGFQNKGCISDTKFHHMITTNFDPSITKEDCQELMGKYSGDKQNLDVLSFMKVVFEEEPFTKPRINVLDPSIKRLSTKENELSETLVKKINDLNEGGLLRELNMNASDGLGENFKKYSRKSSPFKKAGSESISKLTGMNGSEPSLHQTLWSSANPRYKYTTKKEHSMQFVPTQYAGINQQKTRFGATPIIQLNDQSALLNKRQKIVDEKEKVMAQLNNERELSRIRYQNKLQKIREHQNRQKENISMIEERAQMRDGNNMKKLREENLAYNYVNYIHNNLI